MLGWILPAEPLPAVEGEALFFLTGLPFGLKDGL
jgi:hypothetical protein